MLVVHPVPKATKSKISIYAVHYRATVERSEQISTHEAVKERFKNVLNHWRKDAHLSANRKGHLPVSMEILTKIESLQNVHPKVIDIMKHQIDVVDDENRPVISVHTEQN